MNQNFIPDSPESQLSDISFPSHISGFESFNFGEVSKGEEDSDSENLDTRQKSITKFKSHKRKSMLQNEATHSSLSAFLKVSTPPKSLTASQFNTLNESSMSKLEAMQAGNQDSFLNSQSDDKGKKLQEFLDEARLTSERNENDKVSLNDAIEKSYNLNVMDKKYRSLFDINEANQTEMDSLFLKEVQDRLQMSRAEVNENTFMDNMTLKDLEDNDENLDYSRAAIEELEKSLALAFRRTESNNAYNREYIESVQRPNLDGSSSGSDSDSVPSSASNFARSGLGTGILAHQVDRSNLPENPQMMTIPERQTAEGRDMRHEEDGDGGGLGDGSSGNSYSDTGGGDGGDGGVSIRGSHLVANTNINRPNNSDEQITPTGRERPVGGSSSQERQVQFSSYIQMQQASVTSASDSGVTNQSSLSEKVQEIDGQDSRLSARYFLAASTPFKDQSTLNWLHQNTFHKSTQETIQQDYTMDTPSSTVMGKLRQLHGEAPDWTFNSTTMMATKLNQSGGVGQYENDQTITNKNLYPDAANASKFLKYSIEKSNNPFETTRPKFLKNPFESMSDNGNEQDLGSSFTSEEFHNNQDLEELLIEDEKIVAQNNNSIYKESDRSEVDWSTNSGLLAYSSEYIGRVSNYFKVKSNELGNLSKTDGPRPKFSDDSHIIKTPPSLDPLPLLKEKYSFDHDKTFSVERVTSQTSNRENSDLSSKCETPKSHYSSHKQNVDTALQKQKIANEPIKMSSNQNKFPVDVQALTIPKTKTEASCLFTDIQERRVSVLGLSNSQILELASCIATMTGINLSLVYKVLNLLSKETELTESMENLLKADVDKSKQSQKTTSMCSRGNYVSTTSPVSNRSSVLNTSPELKSLAMPLGPEQHSWSNASNVLQNPADLKRPVRYPNEGTYPQLPFEGRFHSTQLEAGSIQNPSYKNLPLASYSSQDNSYFRKPPEFENKASFYSQNQPSLPENLKSSELHLFRQREKLYEARPTSTAKTNSLSEFYSENLQSTTDIRRHHSVEYLKKQQLSESVIFPSEVNFEVICVGIAQTKVFQLHNSNNFWLQCQIHSVLLVHNGKEVDKVSEKPFKFPPKIQLEPHASEDLKMKFYAFHPGSYVMKIEVLVAPLTAEHAPLSWTRVGGLMDVVAIAESPDIEILLGENKTIDFGLLGYGANTTQTLCILNKGRADIPLQLCIASGTASSKYFAFGMTKAESCPHNFHSIVAFGQKKPGIALTPAVVTLRFAAPDIPKPIGCEEISCQIDIQTETEPVIPITSITMKAKVGKPKLHSLKTLQVIEFSCNVGETTVRMIPLRNAGSILMDIEAKIVESNDEFSVIPERLQIKPDDELNLKVVFKPKKATSVKGKLVVSLLLDGDQFEWVLQGTARSDNVIARNDVPSLLCNKLALNWGGVEIGQSRQQKLILRNSSETQTLFLSMAVADIDSSFQIQHSHEFEIKELNKFEAVLKPQAEQPVYVLFIPSKLDFVSSSLVLRVLSSSTKFVIPLSGYGGASSLEIKGAKSMNDKLFIDFGQIVYGRKATTTFIVRNKGSRTAFVSINCFSDSASPSRYLESKIDISPNNFTLKEYATERVTMAIDIIKEHQGAFAHLVIVSGDEVLRQQYKSSRKRSGEKHFITPFKLELGACLDKGFLGEDLIHKSLDYSGIIDWEGFFAGNVAINNVTLVASTIQFADSSDHLNNLRNAMDQFTPAQKLSLKKGNSDSKIIEINKKLLWEIKPAELILNASNKNQNAKLQLINYSDVNLTFEFIWPAQTLLINPCKEKIAAKSSLGIRISIKPSFLSQPEDVPWSGSLYIQCNNEQKEVKVYIRNDVISDLSPYISSTEMNPLEVQDVSFIPHQHQNIKELEPVVIISPCILEFSDTNVNMNNESHVSVQSLFSKPCRWILSSIAPPYFKSTNGRGEILRTTYSAFRFAKHSGKLGEYQTMQLSASFHPRSLGVYSQFWDFEIMYEGNHLSKKHRIELLGKGILSDDEISVKKIGTAKPIPHGIIKNTDINGNIQEVILKEKNPVSDNVSSKVDVVPQSLPIDGCVFVKDENIVFNEVAVGETSEQKFRLCNDSNEIQKVRVSGFQSPFSLIPKHTRLSIRPKSYIRVPVYFSPTSSKTSYEGLLIISPEQGSTLWVKLTAVSK